MTNDALDRRHRILIVDDEPVNIAVISEILKTKYHIIIAQDGKAALERARSKQYPPDIILLDIVMPGIDGFLVCKTLKQSKKTADIPIIFITSKTTEYDEAAGFRIGAVDYITKPICPAVMLARVDTHLRLVSATQLLRDQNTTLEERVKKRTEELIRTKNITIIALAELAEMRDNETGNHLKRTQNYVKILAQALRDSGRHLKQLTHDAIELLFISAPLHDIGKVGIPDRILHKPGKLNTEEFEIMKEHAYLGAHAISVAEQASQMGSNSFLSCAKEIAHHHHERWDGSGYPDNLKGTKIPLSCRIMAIADTYDALISERVYKPAYSHQRAVEIIRQSAGSHFDPTIVKVFLDIHHKFDEIARFYANTDETPVLHIMPSERG